MSLLDLLRPRWRNSDPAIRIAALRSLDANQQEVFVEVLAKDTALEVRRVAAQKLNRLDVLRQLRQDSDAEIRETVLTKLQEEYTRILRNVEGAIEAEHREMLRDLSGAPQLEDLLRNGRSVALRLELLELTSKNSVLTYTALRDEDEGVAMAAAQKLTGPKSLQDVADNSRHVKVRQYAQSQLQAKTAPANDAKNLHLQKLQTVLAHAQRLLEQKVLLPLQEEFTALQHSAASLKLGELQGEFDALVAQFAQRIAAEKAELEQIAAAQQAAAAQKVAQEQLLAELQEIAAGPAIGREAEVKDLQARWEALDGADASLTKRFNEQLKKFYEQIEAMRAARQNEEKMSAWRSKVLSQLAQLHSAVATEIAGKQVQSLVDEWAKLPTLDAADPLQQQFVELQAKLQNVLDQNAAQKAQAVAERKEQLQALIAAVKAIDEKEEFKEISIKLRQIANEWRDIVGDDKFTFQDLWHEYRAATAKFEEMKDWEFWRNEQERDAIIQSVKDLLHLEDAADAVGKLRGLQQAWKDAGYIAQNKLQGYWDEYKAACDQVADKFQHYFVDLENERQANLAQKIALCEKVEAITADEAANWKEKSQEVQAIQKAWKEIGAVPREQKQEVWNRFRTACDAFFQDHKEYLSEVDDNRQDNLTQKLALCEQAEALQDSTDWQATTQALRNLQNAWKEVGPVPREQSEAVWNRFRTASDKFFAHKREHFEALDQEKQNNLAQKLALCEKLESLDLDPTQAEIVAQVAEIEAQWHAIGMVPKEDVESIWTRFSQLTDEFLQKRAAIDPELAAELAERKNAKLAMIAQVREFIDDAGASQAANTVRDLQEAWRALGRTGSEEQELFKEFRDVCDEFFTSRRDQLDIQEQARRNNLQRKELLVEQAERILTSGDLSERSLDEVKHLRRLWREVGSVPRRHSDRVWKRFNSACDAVFAAVRGEKNTQSSEGGE